MKWMAPCVRQSTVTSSSVPAICQQPRLLEPRVAGPHHQGYGCLPAASPCRGPQRVAPVVWGEVFTRQKSLVRTQPRPLDETAGQRLALRQHHTSWVDIAASGPRRGHSNLVLDPSHSDPPRERGAVYLTRTVVASIARVAGCAACRAAGLPKWLRSDVMTLSGMATWTATADELTQLQQALGC
jgi:hypothetical protein